MQKFQIYSKNENTGEFTLDERITDYLEQYFRLDFYGTKVKAPYFINTKKRKDLRALVGKGTPDEMVLETKVWAQVKKLDLAEARPEEIRDLMLKVGIGIDCSGMIYHALNHYLKEEYGYTFKSLLNFGNNGLRAKLARFFRSAENVGANDMTSERNTEVVKVLDVMPGDFIRGVGKQRNAYHVAIITKVIPGKEIYYTHSHRAYKDENGVRNGKVLITNPDGDFLQQDWQDNHSEDGINYLLEGDLRPYPEESGFRRLKFLS